MGIKLYEAVLLKQSPEEDLTLVNASNIVQTTQTPLSTSAWLYVPPTTDYFCTATNTCLTGPSYNLTANGWEDM